MVAHQPSGGDSGRFERLFPWIATALGIVIVLLTYRDYGAAWDEGVTSRYGELCLDYFASGGEDTSCNEYLDLRFYGPLVDMIPALLYDGDTVEKYETRHLFLGLLGVLSIPAVWLYARLLAPRAAVFAVIAMATMPRFYGQWFNNSKDAPFAVLVAWLMVAIAAMFAGSRVRWRETLGCGVAMGLALCARPGGFPLFLLFLGSGAAVWVLTREPSAMLRAAGRLVPKMLAVVLVAWPLMVAPWPWAHEDPLGHPVEAMQVAAKFHTTMPVLFEGATWRSDRLPWYYVAKYVAITTPVPVLVLAALGLARGVADQVTSWRTQRSRVMTMAQVWLLAPVLIFAVLRPNVYGGMRHFLFVLTPLGLLAGYGAAGIVAALGAAWSRRLVGFALVVVLLLPVVDLVRLHPYQMTFYNALVGGVGGVQGRYWTDYPLATYCEAIRWINGWAAESPEKPVVAVIAAPPMVMMWAERYAAPGVELVSAREVPRGPPPPEADWYVGNTRNRQHLRYPRAPVVHTVGRGGAVFTVIKDLR